MKITENTTVTLTVVAAIVGGVMWLQSIHSLANTTAEKTISLEAKQDRYSEDIVQIKQALSRIEGKLDR